MATVARMMPAEAGAAQLSTTVVEPRRSPYFRVPSERTTSAARCGGAEGIRLSASVGSAGHGRVGGTGRTPWRPRRAGRPGARREPHRARTPPPRRSDGLRGGSRRSRRGRVARPRRAGGPRGRPAPRRWSRGQHPPRQPRSPAGPGRHCRPGRSHQAHGQRRSLVGSVRLAPAADRIAGVRPLRPAAHLLAAGRGAPPREGADGVPRAPARSPGDRRHAGAPGAPRGRWRRCGVGHGAAHPGGGDAPRRDRDGVVDPRLGSLARHVRALGGHRSSARPAAGARPPRGDGDPLRHDRLARRGRRLRQRRTPSSDAPSSRRAPTWSSACGRSACTPPWSRGSSASSPRTASRTEPGPTRGSRPTC